MPPLKTMVIIIIVVNTPRPFKYGLEIGYAVSVVSISVSSVPETVMITVFL